MSFSLEDLEKLMGFGGRTTDLPTEGEAEEEAPTAPPRVLPPRAPSPTPGDCGVCGESNVILFPSTELAGKPCRHVFCKPCHSQWITTQVQNRERVIVCPEAGCGHALHPVDIARLAEDPAIPAVHSALLAESYTERQQEMMSDPELKAWMDANARACPKCSVIITRATGCNAVACPCGHKFCFCCGQVKCAKQLPQTSANAFHALLEQQAQLWREAQLSRETQLSRDPKKRKIDGHTMSPAVRLILEAAAKGVAVNLDSPVMVAALEKARPEMPKK